MTLDLTALGSRVQLMAAELSTVGLQWTTKPVAPNYGKPVMSIEFEGSGWLASVIAWETGEVELDAGRIADGWGVTKHYEIESEAGFDRVLGELVALVRDGTVPPEGLTSWLPTRG